MLPVNWLLSDEGFSPMTEDTNTDPIELFRRWLAEAEETEPNDPNAMSVATVDALGRPSVRMLLLKGVDPRGFVFYTNLESHKGRDLAGNPQAGLCFHWKSLRRQVRIDGPVEPVSAEEADAYFHSRPRGSQIGAWASEQSRPMEGHWVLERRVAEYALHIGIGAVPRPPHWSGFRVLPRVIEFWRDRPFRLHERMVYHAEGEPGAVTGWTVERLFP